MTTTQTPAMRQIRIEKLVLNCGCGTDHNRLEKSVKLLKKMVGRDPVKVTTSKRIPNWGLRPGLPIGTKVTLRGKQVSELLSRLLDSKDRKLPMRCFDEDGNVAFGIKEYINIPGVEYEPELGIIGLQVTITLSRPGFRLRRRDRMSQPIPAAHKITKNDAIEYAKSNWKIDVIDDEATVEEQ